VLLSVLGLAVVGGQAAGASGGGGGLSGGSATTSDPPLNPFTTLSLASPSGNVQAVVYDGNQLLIDSSVTTTLTGFTAPSAPLAAKTTYVVFDGQCGPLAPNGCVGRPTGGSGDTLAFTGGAGTLTNGPDAFKGSDPCPWGPDTCLWDTRNFDVSAQVAPGDTSVAATVTAGDIGDSPDCINHEAQAFAVGPAASSADAGYVAAGVGLRNQGSGAISISGIPFGSVVQAADLYWAVLNSTDPGNAMTFNGSSAPGTLVNFGGVVGGDPCWDGGSWAYRADVTSLVSGNGTYTLSGYPTGSTSGLNPWDNPSPTPMMEGASLVVFYSFPPTPCKVTGGGSLTPANDTFGFVGKSSGSVGNASGNLEFQARDVSPNQDIKSTSITGVGCSGNTATIKGTARVNGAPGATFTAVVADNGEPGTADTFAIQVSNGYSASGTLTGGNIQIH